MRYQHTFSDGGMIYKTVSDPAPVYDEFAESILYQAYAYCPNLTYNVVNGNYPIYRVTWYPHNGWETMSEQHRCDWDQPARIEKAEGYYAQSVRQLFLHGD